MRILTAWYSHCRIDRRILLASLRSLEAARVDGQTPANIRCAVWEHIPGNPHREYLNPHHIGTHLGIALQIARIFWEEQDRGETYDAVCFCEHDVLYPPDYFDLTAQALDANPSASGVRNLDYIGLNETGWLPVVDRHDPLHQLSMRWDYALRWIEGLIRDCVVSHRQIVEPPDVRETFAARPYVGHAPSVHINQSKPFTSHYNCYSRTGIPLHPFWGDFRRYYPEGEHDARS